MSLVNGEDVHRLLEQRYKTWIEEAKKPDVQKAEWVRGVLYGIRLAQRDVCYLLNRSKTEK